MMVALKRKLFSNSTSGTEEKVAHSDKSELDVEDEEKNLGSKRLKASPSITAKLDEKKDEIVVEKDEIVVGENDKVSVFGNIDTYLETPIVNNSNQSPSSAYATPDQDPDDLFQTFSESLLVNMDQSVVNLAKATGKDIPTVLEAIYFSNGDMAMAFEHLTENLGFLWSAEEDFLLFNSSQGSFQEIHRLIQEKGGFYPLIERMRFLYDLK